jgi:uncharacterized protein (TIGR02246 family)
MRPARWYSARLPQFVEVLTMNLMHRSIAGNLLFALLVACAPPAPPAPSAPAADTAADEMAVRTINPAWFAAYAAGDADPIVALYHDDAVVIPPGAPAASGQAAIREFVVADIAGASAAGRTTTAGSSSDVGVSGDLAWESGTFTVTDKSGAVVDSGRFLTVFQRREGGWKIVRDIWNSEAPPPAAAASAEK